MVEAGIDAVQLRGPSNNNKKNFAIWSNTFELEDLAIALYLVKIDQWLRRVSGRCILLRPSNAPILN
jgi:hypothetical protein